MAGLTGLEPATSCVTGRRSNQLNYNPAGVAAPANAERGAEKPGQDSRGFADCQKCALAADRSPRAADYQRRSMVTPG